MPSENAPPNPPSSPRVVSSVTKPVSMPDTAHAASGRGQRDEDERQKAPRARWPAAAMSPPSTPAEHSQAPSPRHLAARKVASTSPCPKSDKR